MNPSFVMPDELTIHGAAAVREALLDWVGGAGGGADASAWVLDASRVSEVDAAGLQLLLALRRLAATRSRTLRIVGAGIRLRRGMTAVGLEGDEELAGDGASGPPAAGRLPGVST